MENSDWRAQLGQELWGSDFELARFPVLNGGRKGLLGFTDNITPELVLSAYLQGVFPWYNEDEGDPVLWWCPDPRFVLPVEDMHVPESVFRFLKHTPYTYTMDKAFPDVMRGCASMERKGQNGTWIGTKMIEVYCELARRGIARSVEAWHDGKLAGGFYGVLIGRMFCGESMFTAEDNSSKSAFVLFEKAFAERGGMLIDSQAYTANMARYGAHNISRAAFLRLEKSFLMQTLKAELDSGSLLPSA